MREKECVRRKKRGTENTTVEKKKINVSSILKQNWTKTDGLHTNSHSD